MQLDMRKNIKKFMKKKILFLIPLPPPIHGVSMINKSIFNSKKIKKNFAVSFIKSSTTTKFKHIGKFKVLKLLTFAKICFYLIEELKHFKPNLVYFNLSPHGLGFCKDIILILIIKIFKVKVVFHMHGKGIKNEIKKHFLIKKIYKYVFKSVDLICLSKLLIKDIEQIRDKSTSVQIVNNFAFGARKLYLKSKSKKITFIFLSNLVPTKGIFTFLDAIEILQKKNNRYDFDTKIVGNYSNKSSQIIVEKKISNLKNIIFLGPQFGEKKYKELSFSNVLVFPTRHHNEAFPVVLLEAMSSKLAIITTDEGGIPDIVTNGADGLILKNCSPSSCAGAMLRYLNNKNLVIKHGNSGYKKFQKYFLLKRFEINIIKALKKVILTNEL